MEQQYKAIHCEKFPAVIPYEAVWSYCILCCLESRCPNTKAKAVIREAYKRHGNSDDELRASAEYLGKRLERKFRGSWAVILMDDVKVSFWIFEIFETTFEISLIFSAQRLPDSACSFLSLQMAQKACFYSIPMSRKKTECEYTYRGRRYDVMEVAGWTGQALEKSPLKSDLAYHSRM